MELRPYQKDDVKTLLTLNSAGIFNEQRTGKTPTVLTALMAKNCHRNIIVAPASTLPQWKAEYERWTGEPCVILNGTKAKVKKAFENWTHGAVISYGLFKNTKAYQGYVDDIIKSKPDAIVLDEAHRIKDPKSAAAKAAHACRTKIPVRFALSGTPAPNKQDEIFSILKFLKPEIFSSYWKFISDYFYTYQSFVAGRTISEVGHIRQDKLSEFQEMLDTFCISRKRINVMPWLPLKDYERVALEPTKEQTKYLKELKMYYETEDIVTQGALDRLIRYRQICLAPELLGLKGKSPKMDYILEYLKDYPDRPTLIFSKFTQFLHLLSAELTSKGIKHEMIVGEVPVLKRREIQLKFQNGELDLILIQIDAGKEGLTLDRAETTIFCDKFPPAGDIQQAEDRFVATTEDKKHKPHTIIELMITGTYDEELYDLVLKNQSAIDVVNNFNKYLNKGA